MPLTSFKGADYEKWLTPKQAILLLDPTDNGGSLWRSALLERLRGGRVEAVAEGVQLSGSRAPAAPRNQMGPSTVAPKIWDSVDWNDRVFFSGDLTHEEHFGAFDILRTRFFNVRFRPDDINAMVPKPLAPITADPVRTEIPSTKAAPDERKPVSPANLTVWADIYNKIYGGTPVDTLDFAWESAKGMFPDKSVSRDRVRALVGGNRKSGRKPRTAE